MADLFATEGDDVIIACPHCEGRLWVITYMGQVDDHRYVCAACGERLIIKRLRDLD